MLIMIVWDISSLVDKWYLCNDMSSTIAEHPCFLEPSIPPRQHAPLHMRLSLYGHLVKSSQHRAPEESPHVIAVTAKFGNYSRFYGHPIVRVTLVQWRGWVCK